jgi:WD40 repeat protein
MSGSVYSGNTLYALASTPASFGSSGAATARSSPDFIDPATVVYAAAGLGVVHNLATNQQLYFDGHTDDVTCITVSQDGQYAATGQMGRAPMVHIWPTDIAPGRSSRPLNTISNNFFARGVNALAFSYDNKYLVAIGCDDNHALGVFDTSSCALVIEAPCQHGIPPQIRWLDYCPGQLHTEYITREHAGLCDVFATAGERIYFTSVACTS